EFATLRAIGSTSRYIYTVIIWQALLSAIVGFAGAAAIGKIVAAATAESALPVIMTPLLTVALFVLTLTMCIGSAIAAIVKVMRIDPTLVFSR
ncbi:MAG: FtsX-like permease family protein, partial [Bradyrhizobium sp.]|nr:FtsX-like permease family protein [Bradyrhizobium sp.]